MTNIKFDAHNYRTHDEKNLKLIKKSLKELGAGRSIVIDAEGEIIAGNATCARRGCLAGFNYGKRKKPAAF